MLVLVCGVFVWIGLGGESHDPLMDALSFPTYFRTSLPENSSERAERQGYVDRGMQELALAVRDTPAEQAEAEAKYATMRFDNKAQQELAYGNNVKVAKNANLRAAKEFKKAQDLARRYGFTVKDSPQEYWQQQPAGIFVLGEYVPASDTKRYEAAKRFQATLNK